MKRLRSELTYANVISTLCLVLLLGGGAAFAATQLPKNSVGAKQLKKGAVTPTKLSAAARSTMTASMGQQGLKGDTGSPGLRGEPGAPATALWAVVDEDGELLHGTALSTILNGGTGTYLVTFDRDVSDCALLVTTQEQTAKTRAEPLPGEPNTVFVLLESSTSQIEGKFSLGVFC